MRNKILGIIAALVLVSGIAYAVPTPASLLQDQAAGKLVDYGGATYAVVTVTGQSPPAQTKFACNLQIDSVLGLCAPGAGAIRSGPADFATVRMEIALADATLPTSATTTGAMAQGDIAAQGANLWMKVVVNDAIGVTIDPSVDTIWAYKLNGGTAVVEVADSLAVTKIDAIFKSVTGSL